MLKSSLYSLILIVLTSCASLSMTERIDDINKPLKLVRYSILKAYSTGYKRHGKAKNLYISKPFVLKGRKLVSPTGSSRYHYVAKSWIRGGRRPYSVDIEVFKRQALRDGSFKETHPDQRIAKIISKNIQKELSKSHKGSNIIDDFRIF